MKLKSLTSSKEETKEKPEQSADAVVYVPTFNVGDTVTLDENHVRYNNSHSLIKGKKIKVEKCYEADLGDMIVEVLYLSPIEGVEVSIRNPYLAEHFKKVEHEKTN
ncbi:MAG: hypothetical protein CMC35_03075 [Flavobacteriaceae bacterium]|nr:hypothetical protein [Flavobacteriaceae bacterium]